MLRFMILVMLAIVVGVAAHAAMTQPPPRTNSTQQYAGQCQNGVFPGPGPAKWRLIHGKGPANGPCDWYNQGCQIGCAKCNTKCGHVQAGLDKCCDSPMKPTLNEAAFRTYCVDGACGPFGRIKDGMESNPWRAPGFAPVIDPCGIAGGGEPDAEILGFPTGISMADLPAVPGVETIWEAGSEQEVSFGIFANHGGGYSYRLCPLGGDSSRTANQTHTESCFQKLPLQFVGDTQWIQFGADKANRTVIAARRTSEGTNPPGSQWTRNPIPACYGYAGGAAPGDLGWASDCKKPQFEPPLKDIIPAHPKYAPTPGLYGFGPGSAHGRISFPPGKDTPELDFWNDRFNFNIIDKVQVPPDLSEGNYLLSFRWDAEQTPQVWGNCGDIKVKVKKL